MHRVIYMCFNKEILFSYLILLNVLYREAKSNGHPHLFSENS